MMIISDFYGAPLCMQNQAVEAFTAECHMLLKQVFHMTATYNTRNTIYIIKHDVYGGELEIR